MIRTPCVTWDCKHCAKAGRSSWKARRAWHESRMPSPRWCYLASALLVVSWFVPQPWDMAVTVTAMAPAAWLVLGSAWHARQAGHLTGVWRRLVSTVNAGRGGAR